MPGSCVFFLQKCSDESMRGRAARCCREMILCITKSPNGIKEAKGGGSVYHNPKNIECQWRMTELATATSPGVPVGMCNTRFLWDETHVQKAWWRVLHKTAEKQPKKKELMNGWVLARIREGKCGTWLNRLQELSNHQMHLRCSRRRQWDYLTVWGRSSVFEPVFLTSKESMFPALVRTYNQIK